MHWPFTPVVRAGKMHGIRYESINFNPRCSAIRVKESDVLSPEELRSILPHLPLRERAMVMLVGSTGLRRSELFALRWSNINMDSMEVSVKGNVVRNRPGNVKTKASAKPVSLHGIVRAILNEWRKTSPYPYRRLLNCHFGSASKYSFY